MTPEELEQQKQELYKVLLKAMTFNSDESEGQQVIDIDNIDLCSVDYIDLIEPDMTPDEINHLFHFDDPNILPANKNTKPDVTTDPNGTDNYPSSDTDGQGGGPEFSLIDNNPQTGKTNLPGGGNGLGLGLGNNGDKKKRDINDGDYLKDRKNDYNNIRIPDGANVDDIVKAILDDDNPETLCHAIVEFSTPSLQDEIGVEYELAIKPGEKLTSDTIIGKVTQNGVTKPLRSIFSKGTVLANEDGTDFKHLFESSGATRHFIVEDFELGGEAPDFNTDIIDQITGKFKREAYLNQFIGDNICESVLPWILTRRYEGWKYKMIGGMRVHDERPNGRELYRGYMLHVADIRNQYLEDIKSIDSEDNIKSTNGNIRKINDVGYSIIDRRKQYIIDLIYCYTDYKLTVDLSEYDPDYSDCKFLAWERDIAYRSRNTHTKIGDTDYDNYYVSLLSRLDMNDSTNPYTQEYFQILKKIIEKRLTLEKYSIDVLIGEFNKLFHDKINSQQKDGYSKCYKDLMTGKTPGDITQGDILSWIAQNQNSRQIDGYTSFASKQLANIYLFIISYKEYEIEPNNTDAAENEEGQEHPMYTLIKEETSILQEFWDRVIAEWYTISLPALIEECKTVGDNVNQYAEWPLRSYLQIGYHTYEYYLFQNDKKCSDEEPDEDLGTDYITNEPTQPTEMAPPDWTQADLNANDNDPAEDEPTPKDFRYWQRYFGLATIISLPFLNCGLDIMPDIQLIPLPCIFICLSAIYIKLFDITIVIGISIRGMYIWPIVLFVNLSNQYASILTPLIGMLKTIQSKISAQIEALLEKPIYALSNGFIYMLEEDNRRLRRENIQLTNYQNQIAIKKVKNMEKIRKDIARLKNPGDKQRQHIIDPLHSEEQDT